MAKTRDEHFFVLISRICILFKKMTTEIFLFIFTFILIAIFLPYRQTDMKFRYGLCFIQIFNVILLRFSRRLRNSPLPWVRHTQRPALPDALKKPHPKAKSSMSLRPHPSFIRFIQPRLVHHPGYYYLATYFL